MSAVHTARARKFPLAARGRAASAPPARSAARATNAPSRATSAVRTLPAPTSLSPARRSPASGKANSRSSFRHASTSSNRGFGAKGAVEIDARLLPAALHRAFRHAAHRRDFGEGEAAKEFEVYHLGERGVDLGELVQCLADLHELFFVDDILHDFAVQRGDLELAPAFLGTAASSMVDNHAPHHPGGIPHESGSVGKGGAVPPGDSQIG